ncbi:MAG: two-component sensor histidine kinase [Deltaproteobacteria bacterium]|nr:two-component sensor histidine kinase [Deltaproteobacteria bacterium]MBW1793646.1 two-component sensor histidine kinase [Deltaproteobacteria bacterium]MBW2330011.1 two-component sensor histidine kinase [Deltaproteobacteria bacterium]
MSILSRVKPDFWNHRDGSEGPFKHLFDFRRIWKLAVGLSAAIALAPVISMAVFEYKVTHNAMEAEVLLRTARLVSNTRRTVSFFFSERKAALDLLVRQHTLEELKKPDLLTGLLEGLQKAVGGFTDLGVVDHQGRQQSYVGPYELEGVDYSDQEWFKEVVLRGVYISDVFLGFRDLPHLVIAVKHDLPDGSFYVLRATLDTARFNDLLSQLEVSGNGDAFIINREGIIQTPPRYCGRVLGKISLPVPEYSSRTRVLEEKNFNGQLLVIGYAYVTETPFILVIGEQKAELMKSWYRTRTKLIGFLAASIVAILVVILGVATHLVNKIYLADEKRVMTLHQVEYANKMASIGRLAAGVAHEINNPLAIINEKAGLIKDIFTYRKEYARDEKLLGLVEWILTSVGRCGAITRRLLSFARHMHVSIEPVQIKEVIDEVTGLLGKEAEYRDISIHVDVSDDVPAFESDRGKLQQIFLNLVNNAFAAMSDGGRLDIKVRRETPDAILLRVTDDGCGIPPADLKRIFEPFFSTKKKKGGTGLGLSITYGLVKELGGTISVQSEVGKGTSFTISLPIQLKQRKKGNG